MVWAWLRWWRGRTGAALQRWQVVLYTRQGCHCCARAHEQLERAGRRHGFVLQEIDVDSDPDLAARHGLHVPVVEVNGRVRFRGVVNPVLLERLLRSGAAP